MGVVRTVVGPGECACTVDVRDLEMITKLATLAGTGIRTDLKLIRKRWLWVIPPSRFVEYEPQDEMWARPLGYGKDTLCPEVAIIKNCVIDSVEMPVPDLDGGPDILNIKFRAIPPGQ